MKKKGILLVIVAATVILLGKCKHDELIPDGYNPDDTIHNPIDTTHNPVDTIHNPVDTTPDIIIDTTGTPCDSGLIYFNQDVLPLLSTSCAIPGCHDSATAEKGIILENYNSTMGSGEIVVGNAIFSRLYLEMLIKQMPPDETGIVLTTDQINLVRDWINQGAQNLTCNPNYGHIIGCDTLNVSFSATVEPIINTYCRGCHIGAHPQGDVSLENYAAILVSVNDGKLVASVSHAYGAVAMPYHQPKLSDCKISRIRNWVNAGAPNN